MTDPVEIRNRRIGFLVSVLIHGALTLLFFFLLAWKAPLPEGSGSGYGIELNIGFDDSGTGDIQPLRDQPETEGSIQENRGNENIQPENGSVADQADQITDESSKSDSPVEDKDSPDRISDKNKVESVSGKTDENKKPSLPSISESGQVTGNNGQKNAGVAGDENNSTSQGDKIDAKGDQGNPQGSIDARALYGTPGGGGGGGSSLEMAGWIWDFEPRPKDTSTENGKIVFEIKINDRGEILSVRTLEKTVTPAVEKIYREAVEEITFSSSSANTHPAATSTGKITFIIRSR